MTAAADETWIQSSLARLETLEVQREQFAASGQTDRLAETDEEIRSLYEVLESVADDGEPETAPANGGGPAIAVAPMHAVPQQAPPGMAAAPVAAAPVAAAPAYAAAPAMAPMQAQPTDTYVDDDIKPPRGPLPMILAGLLVLGGGGAAAYAAMGGSPEEVAAPAPSGPAQVIEAGAIAEDTQEPQVAKGAEGDRTRGTNFKQGSTTERPSASGRRSGSSSSRSSSSRSGKSDDGRKIKFSESKDPLGGVD